MQEHDVTVKTNAAVSGEDEETTKDGTAMPEGHHAGDGHDHDGDGKPSVSQE